MKNNRKVVDEMLLDNKIKKQSNDIETVMEMAAEQGRLMDIPLDPLAYIAYLMVMHRQILKKQGKI